MSSSDEQKNTLRCIEPIAVTQQTEGAHSPRRSKRKRRKPARFASALTSAATSRTEANAPQNLPHATCQQSVKKQRTDDRDTYESITMALHVLGDGAIELRLSSVPNGGFGLFALRDFTIGEPITEYAGQLVTFAEAQKRRNAGMASHIRSHVPLRFAIDGQRLTDGTPITDPLKQLNGRGIGAYANHGTVALLNADFDRVDSSHNLEQLDRFVAGSPTACIDPEQRVTFLRATRPIRRNAEIFVDYGRDYWRLHQSSKSTESWH